MNFILLLVPKAKRFTENGGGVLSLQFAIIFVVIIASLATHFVFYTKVHISRIHDKDYYMKEL